MVKRILVIGDCMVDRYLFGNVDRLSQEAPVPVVKYDREEYRAGAAANVAVNCAALGADVTLIGIVGDDEGADILHGLVHAAGVKSILLRDDSIKTTQKLRIIGRGQQIVRIDFEQRPLIGLNVAVIEPIRNHDIIVFSDYDKGALIGVADLIAMSKEMGKTVLVDPKGHDYSKYSGADLVKPNLHEMKDMAGGWTSEDQLTEKANRLRADANIGALLVTRAADGMTLYDGETHHIPSMAREVYDVTGAGDTVIACTAVMLSKGMTLLQATTIANAAAGIACGKFGTSVVTANELARAT